MSFNKLLNISESRYFVKSIVLIIIIFTNFHFCYSQKNTDKSKYLNEVKDASYYDSTLLFSIGEKVISQFNDNVTRSEVYLYYGNYFYYTQRLEKAKSYFEFSLREAIHGNSKHFEILAKTRLAFLEYDNGQHFSGEKKLKDLLEISRQEKDFSNVAEILNLLAIIKEGVSDSKDAGELYYEGLSIAEEYNLSYYKAVFRNNLGLLKFYSGQIDSAERDFKEGLEIALKNNDLRIANHLKMNLCLAYVHKNQKEEAYKLFDEVILYSKKNNLPIELASNYINLGSAVLTAGSPETAIAYFDSSIQTVLNYKLYSTLIRGYYGKVEAYLKMNNIKEAENNINIADTLIEKQDNLMNKANFFNLRYQVEYAKCNFKNALEDYVYYTLLNDSINNDLNTKVIEELQFNYRVQQKEAELAKERSKTILLEIQNQKEKFIKWLVAGASLIILIILSAFIYNRYLRKLKEKQAQFSKMLIENIEEERKRISMDLHDDIGQNLSIVKSKVLKSVAQDNMNIEEDISRLIDQTRELSRNLYPSNIEKIGITRAVASLMESLQAIKGLECSYEFCTEVEELPFKVQTNIFRIIQECINNTVKHSGATGLKITIQKRNSDFIMIYLDNGSGIKTKKAGNGIGLLSIQERARIINGNIDIDEKAEKGFKLTLRFRL